MKKKRYTLPEEQPIPVGWHPANEEEAADRIEAIEAEYEMILVPSETSKKILAIVLCAQYLKGRT